MHQMVIVQNKKNDLCIFSIDQFLLFCKAKYQSKSDRPLSTATQTAIRQVGNQCVYRPTSVASERLNPLNPELNPICYLLALLGAQHFLHVSRVRVKLLTFRLLMSYIYIYIYIYGAPILDVSRSHTTAQHSR